MDDLLIILLRNYTTNMCLLCYVEASGNSERTPNPQRIKFIHDALAGTCNILVIIPFT